MKIGIIFSSALQKQRLNHFFVQKLYQSLRYWCNSFFSYFPSERYHVLNTVVTWALAAEGIGAEATVHILYKI